MKLNERQNIILNLLQESEQLEVDSLSDQFGVSSQTIRKDINQMCDLGLVRRLHGGVGLPTANQNISFNSREMINSEVKRRMAAALAALIPDGASVMLGIGTSVSHAARALINHRRLRIITNNLNVASILCEQPEIEVLVSGGQLRHNDRDLVGENVTRFLDNFRVDFGIIGTGALDQNRGLMDFDPLEADVSRAILRNCGQAVLLADQSKWKRRAMVQVAPFTALSKFITDELSDPSPRQQLQDSGLDIIETGQQ
ncbi:DeoR/GlpR family DNA-binding transcription regulator [Amphritea sp.]|uniref:DeoR/GlpR family DNA-binding transcription regulator n=1 Tax=Amphritea sp. TaxID=1872502 RepID=UPI003D121B29